MPAVLPHQAGDGDLVAGVQAMLGPPGSGQFVRGRKFALPVFDFPLVILDVEVNLAMRIDEPKLRDLALYRKRISRIISGSAVVSERKTRKHQNGSNRSYNCE